jgi:hypothetical protein
MQRLRIQVYVGIRLIGREERLVERSESLYNVVLGTAAENDTFFNPVVLNNLRPKRVLTPE